MKRWSVGKYTAQRKGTMQFGMTLWGHEHRTGLQLNFWRWEVQVMRERRDS